MEHPPTTAHNYLPKVIAFAKAVGLREGDVSQLVVAHDEWCNTSSGGFCNCDPTVSLRELQLGRSPNDN